MMRQFVVALLLMALASVATAADRNLSELVTLWLDGDDATALPGLAILAQEGDADARILLARIELADRGYSPFVANLSRKDRRILFRNVSRSTPFGRSWLSVEAEDGDKLALALLNARQPHPDLELITQLLAMGERQASDHPTRILALYGSEIEKYALLSNPDMLDALRPYLVYNLQAAEPRGDGLAALRHLSGHADISAMDKEAVKIAGILALGFPYGDVSPENKWRQAIEDWLLSAPETKPVADLCELECAKDAGACAFVMMALSGGYFEVIRNASPLETLVPQEAYAASPRARLTALRRAALTRAETDEVLASFAEIAEMSQCAAELISNTRAAY